MGSEAKLKYEAEQFHLNELGNVELSVALAFSLAARYSPLIGTLPWY